MASAQILTRISPSVLKHLPRQLNKVNQVRWYTYDKDIYGFRSPKKVDLPDYTDIELQNRNAQSSLVRLVEAFHKHGHLNADLDPLGLQSERKILALDPKSYGLAGSTQTFQLAGILHISSANDPSIPKETATIDEIIGHLRKSYTSRIGFEFEHTNDSETRWMAQYIESFEKTRFKPEEKMRFFSLLTKSEVFDHFMAKRFPQVKRYGLEGAESMMIALDSLFKHANLSGVRDIVLCMPHRGRLNFLTDILMYSPTALFHKIKGNREFPDDVPGSGDVLSHLSTAVDLPYGSSHPLHVSMIPNPSHLEACNPVAVGKARARQMHLFEEGDAAGEDCSIGDRVMAVQLHGDAAFCGQGINQETLGLSNLPHFSAGGTVHLIVNNQVGFTTPAMNARSTIYTSDVAKSINSPVIHVNADHPEDVARAVAMAVDYRNKFKKDVILDLIAYRRMGHNELDEPSFTQPTMYKNIRARKSVPKMYQEKLLTEKVLADQKQVDEFRDNHFATLDDHLQKSYTYTPVADTLKHKWAKMTIPRESVSSIDTGVAIEQLKRVGQASTTLPTNMVVHPRLLKHHIEARQQKIESGVGLDWASAEALAWGSLMLEGYNVRISGQDVGRGTFSQRHAMLVDQDTERTVIPLNHMRSGAKKQGKLEIANSSLSELAVLGFEYGISWETPNRLCIWEAQFGDFFNGAQVMIDTYVASSETKWLRQSGIVISLPHGYDGAGPEHSSCRVERWLQLCDQPIDITSPANVNMHVANPTLPSQYFHLLRRQMLRPYRRPLIVVGPKVLLKHAVAVSSLSDMAPGTSFLPVLADPGVSNPEKVEKVAFVSGKLYYELAKEREAKKMNDRVAVIRLEELCPFPAEHLKAEIAKFSNAKSFYWIQEEPENNGACSFVEPRLRQLLGSNELHYVGRDAAAAPATGVSSNHKKEQEKI
ncbi:oxoglutarate dehydrogenase (succinyl-transferring) [Synchytrium microbalum]|uniref:Oxoglutarate dehydrogenase (Succinyl-transferring) n=1 Tax=Synchytrium microbalum TaxID=1806994 RepID=A0A507CF49_9FUNG|nr:oxoglutarate dehydrogenase (succinyl-transferring) [Synchytrium microbalum]TPX37988.1 oxoglutarate dehydrogenase (succinyl-transferring) [Synchytrium microbalum]